MCTALRGPTLYGVRAITFPAITISISHESVPDAWRDYLYWTGELSN